MPRSAWSAKDERQYAHVLQSCRRGDKRRSKATCQRIAAATVNKHRAGVGGAFPAGPSRYRADTQSWKEILSPIAVVAGLALVWWALTKIPTKAL